jgi:murein DD-endopeptidase MepM/ murein hydrolase activator NlpD
MRRFALIAALAGALSSSSSRVCADPFTYEPPGQLVPGSGQGRADETVYAPNIRFPIETGPAFANSQVWGHGGDSGPGGDQCDPENFRYPWRDNFCETRTWDMPLCPAGTGHQGQDVRASTCEAGVHRVIAVTDGTITHIGSYTVYLTAEDGTRFDYLHMDHVAVTVGQRVSRGDHVGNVSNQFGSSTTTVHLHFNIQQNVANVGTVFVPPYKSLIAAYQRLLGPPISDAGGTDEGGKDQGGIANEAGVEIVDASLRDGAETDLGTADAVVRAVADASAKPLQEHGSGCACVRRPRTPAGLGAIWTGLIALSLLGRGRRGRRLLAIAFSSAALFAFLPAAPALAFEPSCRPSIEVEADAHLRAEIEEELAHRGLVLGGDRECGVVRAGVARQGRQLVIRISDAFDRSETRAVARFETVASLIETWARPRASARAPSGDRGVVAASAETSRLPLFTPPADLSDPPAQQTSIAAPIRSDAPPRLAVQATAEGYIDNQGTLWAGLSASAKVRLGALYLGPRGRILALARKDDDTMFEPNGLSVEGLLDAETVFALGSAAIRPGAGLGLGWMRRSWEPMEEVGGASEQRVARHSLGPRASLHISAAVPASEAVSVSVGFAADFAPFAGEKTRSPGGFEMPADPFLFGGLTLGASWTGL